MQLGGMAFLPLQSALGVEWATALICAVSAAAMVVPVLTANFTLVLVSFLVLEACTNSLETSLTILRVIRRSNHSKSRHQMRAGW